MNRLDDDYTVLDRPPVSQERASLPETLFLDWTDYCNAKCFFCRREQYEKEIGGRGSFVPFEQLKRLKGPLSAVKYLGISSGIGEPLLHPELEKVLDWLYEINSDVKIRTVTNGTALTATKAKWFSGHLDWLSISLNASKAEAHLRCMFPHLVNSVTDPQKRWELHIRHISEFVAALPADDRSRIRLQAVAHRYNIDELVDFVRLTAEMGVTHAVIPNIAVHDYTVNHSLYWVKDEYNDAIDAAAAVGCELGVRVDAGRFFTSVKSVIDLDKVCRDPIDIAYIGPVGAPCCQWAEADIPIDVYSDDEGFERYWNNDVFRRLREKRDFFSCKNCGMSRVFDETSFHFSPKLKKDLIDSQRISPDNDYPDAALVRICVDNRIDLPSIRHTLLAANLPIDRIHAIEKEGLASLSQLDSDCWEAFSIAGMPVSPAEIALAGPFAGIGWGPPIYEPQNRVSARWLSAGGVGSVFVGVAPGSHYDVQFEICHVYPPTLNGKLKVAVGNRVLRSERTVDKNGRAILHAIVPRWLVDENEGCLWLRVGCVEWRNMDPIEGRASFARLTIVKTKANELARAPLLSSLNESVKAGLINPWYKLRPVLVAVLARLQLLGFARRFRARLTSIWVSGQDS